jgi:hypothetical protein
MITWASIWPGKVFERMSYLREVTVRAMNKSSTNHTSKNNVQIYKMKERRLIETVKGSKTND